MELIVKGILAGVLGTLIMDSLNHLFARIGVISKIDMRIIGRMAVGWTKGRFRYNHPEEIENNLKYLSPKRSTYGQRSDFIYGEK